jgi:hypothetical protein
MNAVRARVAGARGAWWYPAVRSITPKTFGLEWPMRSNRPRMSGTGQLADSVHSLCGMDKDITFWLCHSGVWGAAGCLIRLRRRSAGLFCKLYLALSSGEVYTKGRSEMAVCSAFRLLPNKWLCMRQRELRWDQQRGVSMLRRCVANMWCEGIRLW